MWFWLNDRNSLQLITLPTVIEKPHIKNKISNASFYLSVLPKGKTVKTAKRKPTSIFKTSFSLIFIDSFKHISSSFLAISDILYFQHNSHHSLGHAIADSSHFFHTHENDMKIDDY